MNILSEYLGHRSKECTVSFINSNGVMLLIGNSESGKSFLLKELFNKSDGMIKVFQGGANVSNRSEILNDISYELRKYRADISRHIFLDEFDDEESLSGIFDMFIYDNVKIVISTKMPLHFFAKYDGKFSHMYLTSKDILDIVQKRVKVPEELTKDLCRLELGEWIYIANTIKESITKEDISSAINHRYLELDKKNSCAQSICVINFPGQTIFKFYKY